MYWHHINALTNSGYTWRPVDLNNDSHTDFLGQAELFILWKIMEMLIGPDSLVIQN